MLEFWKAWKWNRAADAWNRRVRQMIADQSRGNTAQSVWSLYR